MNEQHFTNPRLSKKLKELGVVSEFDYLKWVKVKDKWSLSDPSKVVFMSDWEVASAYHFSDILLPENAKKIWPGERKYNDGWDGGFPWAVMSYRLLVAIRNTENHESDWQAWLEQEVDKKLDS